MTTSPSPSSKRARASLPVRLALSAMAVLALLAAAFAAINLQALHAYNQATQSLNANLEASSQPDADLQSLSAQQRQIVEQFSDASVFAPLLLPHIKESIQTNQSLSRGLLIRTTTTIAEQQGGTDPDQAGKQTANAQPDANQSTPSGGALSEEQRRQVEELLKANQQPTAPAKTGERDGIHEDTDGAADDSGTAHGDATVKPW